MPHKTRTQFQHEMELQRAEALSPENRWYAGEVLGHDPSPRECIAHYIEHGGAVAFRDRMNAEQPPEIGGQECQE